MKSGIYQISYEQYEAEEGISKHGLDALSISPLHHWAYYRNPERGKQKETPAKMLGSAIHVSILEPERFEKEYIQEPNIKDYPDKLNLLEEYKKACKEEGLKVTGTKPELKKSLQSIGYQYDRFWDDFYTDIVNGCKVLSEADWRTVRAITARVRKHPSASVLLSEGKSEQSIFWIDRETGIACKGRIDWLNPPNIIVDLKSTTDASLEGFQRSITKYRYYVQAAMYVEGLTEFTGLPINETQFVFAAWEKQYPYASALYYATPEMIEAGRKEYKRLLKVYAECLAKDQWPGYSQEIEPIELPENFKPEVGPESELTKDWLDEMEQGD